MLKKRREKSLLSQTRGLLRESGLRARKGLGQHFLIDESVLHEIVTAARLGPDDLVLEVGPGLGVLTRELVRNGGRVIAVELDDKLVLKLKQMLASFPNLSVIQGDILEIDPATLFREEKSPPVRYKVVANLPYYITSAVLRHFLEAKLKPELMVIMVQKEIARAITAAPGDMSLLAVSVQLYGKPEVVSYVPAHSFYPPPRVDSAILRIEMYPRPALDVDETSFFRLVRAGFTASRKQIPNSLAQGLGISKAQVLPGLEKAGIAPQRRSESLSLEEWGRLWQVFKEEHVSPSGTG